MPRLLCAIALACAAGILCVPPLGAGPSAPWLAAVAAFALAVVCWTARAAGPTGSGRAVALAACVLGAAFCAGGHAAAVVRARPRAPAAWLERCVDAPRPCDVAVERGDQPLVAGPGRQSLALRVVAVRGDEGWWDASALAALSLTAEDAERLDAAPDGLAAVRVRLRRPRPPNNPGESDRAALAAVHGIDWEGRVERGWVAPAPPGAVRSALLRPVRRALARARLAADVAASAAVEGPARGVVRALATGWGGALEPALDEATRRVGLTHLYAVSGLNLTLVVAAAAWLLRRALARVGPWRRGQDPARPAALVALPLAGLYAAFTGGSASAVRAAAMASLQLAAVAGAWPSRPWACVGAAALGMLLVEPGALRTPSFQLSFAALGGLLVIAPLLGPSPASARPGAPAASLARRAGREVATLCVATVAATVATLPLTAWHFGAVPLVGLVSNLVAVPLVSAVLLPLVLAATLTLPLGTEPAGFLFHVAGRLAEVLVAWTHALAALPGASLELPECSGARALGLAVALALAVAALAVARRYAGARRRRAALAGGASLLAAGALLAFTPAPGARPPGRLRVTYLSVGQGDAAVVELPEGGVLVVDGGPSADGRPGDTRSGAGARVVRPFLRWAGIRRVDAAVLSHPHLDHHGGLPALLRAVPVGALWSSGQSAREPGWYALAAAVRETGARSIDFRAPAQRHALLGGATVDVLHPACAGADGAWCRGETTNDNSLVLRIRFGDTTFLFPGDVEGAAERALVATGAELGATVLKVPHHGSRTSSTPALLAAAAPCLAVASLGVDNRFRFPHPSVVARYAAARVPLLRTDLDGAVVVESDGERVTWRAWASGRSGVVEPGADGGCAPVRGATRGLEVAAGAPPPGAPAVDAPRAPLASSRPPFLRPGT